MTGLSNYKRVQKVIRDKAINNKVLTFISLLFALSLLFSSYIYPNLSNAIKLKIIDYSSNIINGIYSPIKTINKSATNLNNIINAYSINNELIKEIENLKNISNENEILYAENIKLKKLLNLSNNIKFNFITAKIISNSNSSFIRSSILNTGKKDNISLYSPVIYNNNVLGYISELGISSSRVTALTDISSKIPAFIPNKDVKVILSGNNSNFLEITNYIEISSIKEGDKVFSSGDGDMYPADLFIGIIKVKADGNIIVEPSKKLNRLSYVQIIDWAPEKRGIDIDVDTLFYD
jgi:rod shape-determining protein MreC